MEFMTLASLATTVVGAGVSLIGGMQQASAQSKAAEYQAQVSRNNQVIADQNARNAAAAGGAKAQANDMQTRAYVGQIEAAQGASGIDSDSPTSTRVRQSAEQIGRLDTATIVHNAILQARNYSAQGNDFAAQAQLSQNTAAGARAAGTIGAFTSLLSGASSFSDKWLRYQNVGVPGFGSAI